MRALLIKLGGSLLTDKERAETPHPERIERLAQEIATAREAAEANGERIVLGHGSGSFGHVAAAAAGLGKGPLDPRNLTGASRTQKRAAALHGLVVEALRTAGLAPFSLAPSSFLLAEGGVVVDRFLSPLAHALRLGLLPVVYGDVVVDRTWGASIASTEAVLSEIASGLPALGIEISRALWLGETEGVYDAASATIPHLATIEEAAVGAVRGTDVTGGMRLRLETCLALARLGIASTILDGRAPGRLAAAIRGEVVPGTRIG
ncbi:MAG TPA: isopentenyl phosphate kinase [Thermoanaerobaculia bacterium]|jgi:isopentenyl phosphate kinase|nr:isopentenyl phosphate kinase [Thermoanaerobaculia bacterium]